MHQVIYNILVTKDVDNKFFEYIYTWGETLSSIALDVGASYNHTIGDTPGQAVFGIDIIFNLTLVIDWRVITAKKLRQVNIDNFCKYAK